MKLKTLINKIEKKFPVCLAYDWDNVGLLVGDYDLDVKKVLVALEANEMIIDEAIENGVDLIITHHPFIFGSMKKINTSDLKGKLIHRLIKNEISLYSMHTNFDIANDGLNDYFMEIMEFENTEVLEETYSETLYKLAVYVPNTHLEQVRDALGSAGAGHIGNYSSCTFNSSGVGTFKPLEDSNPFLGCIGKLEYANETKIETIVPKPILSNVVNKMIEAHPYEEVAYDIYRLENTGQSFGLGRTSTLNNSLTLKELSNHVKTKLGMEFVRVVGDLDKNIDKVSVVTGAGADMVKIAQRAGSQVIITGDVKYHDAQDALDIGMSIIDCGHFETENIFKDVMGRFLNDIENLKVIKSEIDINPFKTI